MQVDRIRSQVVGSAQQNPRAGDGVGKITKRGESLRQIQAATQVRSYGAFLLLLFRLVPLLDNAAAAEAQFLDFGADIGIGELRGGQRENAIQNEFVHDVL